MQSRLSDHMQIWSNREESVKHSRNELDNTITLSETFRNEIDGGRSARLVPRFAYLGLPCIR
jgi:hypothetical protein